MLEVPDRELALADLSDEDVLARLSVLKGEKSTKFLLGELEVFRQNGNTVGIERIAEKVRARAGLITATSFDRRPSWPKAAARYRELLFGVGKEVKGGKTLDGYVKLKGGFTQREIEAVLAAGGKLTLAEVLRCRVRSILLLERF